MRRTDFAFDLPVELIAQKPLSRRSDSRLLVLDGASGACQDRQFMELPALLRPGDLLVFNDTRVVPARVLGRKPTGGAVEMLLERALATTDANAAHQALVQLRASKPLRAGSRFATAGGAVQVLGREAELFRVALPEPALAFFERCGVVPLPPYITRAADANDRERYQSLFARDPGAVAAPTASLHFDAAVLQALAACGIEHTALTLHVGVGTFAPLRVEDPVQHVMHAEQVVVPEQVCAAVRRARAGGGRVVAVGTTVARALESACASGTLQPCRGDTRLFIYPGYRFRCIDVLVTNFHLPESTLLMLVSAFAGREAVLGAYQHAVAQRYRFFSYGDAMLITAAAGVRA